MKALGVGLGAFKFHDVEVVRASSGKPSIRLTGAAADLAAANNVNELHLSSTHTELSEVDAAAAEPVEVLIERAGSAVAWRALRMLGGAYGKRVVVVAGKGNN